MCIFLPSCQCLGLHVRPTVHLVLTFEMLPRLWDSSLQRCLSVPLQEWSLENALDKMQAEWAGLCFETLPWRATGCTILRAVDDIQQVGPYQPALHWPGSTAEWKALGSASI